MLTMVVALAALEKPTAATTAAKRARNFISYFLSQRRYLIRHLGLTLQFNPRLLRVKFNLLRSADCNDLRRGTCAYAARADQPPQCPRGRGSPVRARRRLRRVPAMAAVRNRAQFQLTTGLIGCQRLHRLEHNPRSRSCHHSCN